MTQRKKEYLYLSILFKYILIRKIQICKCNIKKFELFDT